MMSNRELPDKFLVAFSFAGEQRDLVRSVAEAMEQRLGHGTVFFDEWFEHFIAGDDADLRLQEIYGKRSVLVIVCVSERYGGKPWTRAEHRAIRAMQMHDYQATDGKHSHRILPLRVGDGDVPSIVFENTICPDIRQRPMTSITELILNRLRLIWNDDITPVPTIYLAEATQDLRGKKDRRSVELAFRQPQLGFRVLPETNYDRSNLPVYLKALDDDLRQAHVFVQILGESGSESSSELPHGFEGLQFARAKAAGKPCLRWRPSDLDLGAIREFSANYHQYLTDADVTVSGDLPASERIQVGFLKDFKLMIEEAVRNLTVGQVRLVVEADSNIIQKSDKEARDAVSSDAAHPPSIVYRQSFYDWVDERMNEFHAFAVLLTSYLPCATIVCMGFLVGITGARLFSFWSFISSTISLEVCINCLRTNYEIVEEYARLATCARTIEDKSRFKQRLYVAKRLRAWGWSTLGLALTSWMLLAFCEIWHAGEMYEGDIVANTIRLPPLPNWNRHVVGFLSAVTLVCAISNLLSVARESIKRAVFKGYAFEGSSDSDTA
ncbi:MAG: toll/interleukin-1 receptor domain-containing protein [Planctomycetota bacterium]